MNTIDEHFGGCPECGGHDGFLYNGRDNWFICDTHLTKWLVGSGLFSSWEYMTDDELSEQRDLLLGYRVVKPIYEHGARRPLHSDNDICSRCGAHMQATHHPFCEATDGTPTDLADETVRLLLGTPMTDGATGDPQP